MLALPDDATGKIAIDGQAIAEWRDQSPQAKTVVQSDSTRRPIFVADGIRRQPALQFDGDDFLNDVNTNLVAESSARTVFVVGQAGETSIGGSMFAFRRSAPVCALQHILLTDTYYVYSDGVNGAGNSTIPNVIETIRQPFVTVFASAGAGQKLVVWLNGDRQVVVQPGTVGPDLGAGGFTVGQREDYPSYGWNGLIGEVLVYDRVLSDAETTELSRQLALKYRVSTQAVPLNDPPTAETEPLDRAFIRDLYLAAFSRDPSSEELDLALGHLRSLNDRREEPGRHLLGIC